MIQGRRRSWGWKGAVALVALWACGGDTATGVDPLLQPFVGSWRATRLVLRSVANPSIAPNLIELGAAFTMNVQPSGQYTAILIYAEQASTEIGTLRVVGNTVTLQRDFPTRSTTHAVYTFSGNRLTLEGDSEFDFNLDGTPEPALARFELVRN